MEGKEVRFGIAGTLPSLPRRLTRTRAAEPSTACMIRLRRWAEWFPWSISCWARSSSAVSAQGSMGMFASSSYAISVFIAGLMVKPHAGVSRQEDREHTMCSSPCFIC